MGLHQLFTALRDDLHRRGHAATFHSRAAGATVLATYPSLAEVLVALDERDPSTFRMRDELVRAMLVEHRRAARADARTIWATALVLAFAPMLHTLRRRVRGDALAQEEVDCLVLEGLIDALERCPLDARTVSFRIRMDTHRFVMRALVAEQRRRIEQSRLDAQVRDDPGFVVFEWRSRPGPLHDEERVELEQLLRAVAGDAVPESLLEVVISTRIWRQPLGECVASRGPTGTIERRAYERLKRQRTRTLTRLREILAERLSPIEPDLALTPPRLRAAS